MDQEFVWPAIPRGMLGWRFPLHRDGMTTTRRTPSPEHGPSACNLATRAIYFIVLSYIGLALVLFAAADSLRPALTYLTASTSAELLTILGARAHTEGSMLVSSYGRFEIIYECTGVFPTIMIISAVIAFPATWARRAFGLVVGVLFMFLLNQARIISLVYLNNFLPHAVEVVHHLVWPSMIIFSITLLFVIWARTSLSGLEN